MFHLCDIPKQVNVSLWRQESEQGLSSDVRAREGREEPTREIEQLYFDLGAGYISRAYIKIHWSESWSGGGGHTT